MGRLKMPIFAFASTDGACMGWAGCHRRHIFGDRKVIAWLLP